MLTVKLDGIKEMIKRFDDPGLRAELSKIPSMKGVAAIISQAIADNFEREGPGWAPLKAVTLRATVKKHVINKIRRRFLKTVHVRNHKSLNTAQRAKMNRVIDAQLLAHEIVSRHPRNAKRAMSDKNKILPHRKILQKTGLLKKTSTVPGFSGSNKKSQGSNIYHVNGTNLVWGTNLSYAAAHNEGNPKKNLPKREFMVLRDEWKSVLNDFIFQKAVDVFTRYITRGIR
jgi:phage gpG-like protein